MAFVYTYQAVIFHNCIDISGFSKGRDHHHVNDLRRGIMSCIPGSDDTFPLFHTPFRSEVLRWFFMNVQKFLKILHPVVHNFLIMYQYKGIRLSFCDQVCAYRSEEHTSELQSRFDLVCRLLLEKKK